MASQNPVDRPTPTDQILDLLLDALLERNAARRGQSYSPAPPARPPAAEQAPAPAASVTTSAPAGPGAPDPHTPPAPQVPPAAAPRPSPAPARPPVAATSRPMEPPRPATLTGAGAPAEPRPGDPGWELPERQPSINLGKTIVRLAILVAVLAVLINIPIDRYGVSLARVMPDSASLIIRDGLILKGSGSEIYRLEDNKLRWISSLDAFEHLGLTWDDVHVVEDKFLTQFEKGPPIHVILKCQSSPHIYRLENNQKRWIKDIDTFTAEGYVWDDVRFVSCQYLRDLPDGLTIPEDAGPAPEP